MVEAAWLMMMISCCVMWVWVLIRRRRRRRECESSVPLPPGPPYIPIITDFLWLTLTLTSSDSLSKVRTLLLKLHAKHGPITTLHICSRPHISIADPSLARHALLHNTALFSDRPSNHHQQLNITSSSYGPTCRLLRRNLSSHTLQPSFSALRTRVLNDLLSRLKSSSSITHCSSSSSVRAIDHVHDAIFSLLVLMCFGHTVQENQIHHIKHIQCRLISSFNRFSVLNFLPDFVSRVLFRQRWKDMLHLREDQTRVFSELIHEARNKRVMSRKDNKDDDEWCNFVSYVETLLDLELPEEKRKLGEDEVISLCSEFLTAGTHTTWTALEWVMANLVKHTRVQMKLVEEIGRVMEGDGQREGTVKEEELQKLPYLKAVILEGLRRHPPSHFLLPHAVTEDAVLNGYLMPKNGTVNFMVGEMGRDPKLWEDPMEFKPERFLMRTRGANDNMMMPFGAGRRMCPAYNMAMLHLEYFVANLVWKFEWKPLADDDVDLSEKHEFTVVMKHPLQALISPRTSFTSL